MKTKMLSLVALLLASLVPLHGADAQTGNPASGTGTAALAAPLSAKGARFDVFQEAQINAIVPHGWLREFLSRQNSGLTGHHDILSYPFDTCLWAGLIPRKGTHGADWWRYEQTAYLSDGIIRLGYLLNDDQLIKTGHGGVDYILAHPMKNDRLGHPFFESQWPMAVYFRVLQADYLATQNPQLLEALHKHYLTYSVAELNKRHRHIVNLEGMLWTYGQTGDVRLLELAENAYRAGGDEMPLSRCASPGKVVIHGVTYMEESKLPAILYSYTGKKEYLDAAVNAFKKLERDHMLPDGVPSSNEFLAGRDPLQSHETCDISDYTWSIGYLLMATGDATWADRIERAVFNAGAGCVSKDFKNLQYFSSVNQVVATGSSDHNHGSVKSAYGTTWMAYRPCHEVECCAGNVHRFMPNFAARMWMRTPKGGLAATLYGPATITIPVAQTSEKLTVVETTDYPFSDKITFSFTTPRPVTVPFIFRIPAWCETPAVTINGVPYDGVLTPGQFVTLNCVLHDKDTVVLRFPMKAKLVRWDNWGVTVERGPLLFAYAVPEKVTSDTGVYKNMAGKQSPDPVNFPALDLQPAGPWNYAIEANAATALRVVENRKQDCKFDSGFDSISIQVPARRVKSWSLLESRFTPPLPEAGKFECESERETITLVPYGCTRLRLGVFPVAPGGV